MQEQTASTSATLETTPQTLPQAHHQTMALFHHEPHQHQPRNVNETQAAERLSINNRIAVYVSKNVGTMVCAYVFTAIGIGSLVGVLTNNTLLALLLGSLSGYFIQLVLLPVIMVGQNVQAHHSELLAEETFHTTMSTYHDIEQVIQHLSVKDAELLRHAKLLEDLLEQNGISWHQIEAEGVATSHLVDPFAPAQAGGDGPASPPPVEGKQEHP